MKRLTKIWSNIAGYKVDPDTLIAYRTAIPSTINLTIEHRKNHYVAIINSINNEKLPNDVLLVTEAESNDKLVSRVNDLILTYKKVPDLYRPYFKNILAPEGSKKSSKQLTLVKA